MCSKKTKITVRKVKKSSTVAVATRSSPRFAPKDAKDDFKDSPVVSSPIAVVQDNAPVRNSPDAGFGAVDELAAAATITQVVEEIANVVIGTEAETSADQPKGIAPPMSVVVAETSADQPQGIAPSTSAAVAETSADQVQGIAPPMTAAVAEDDQAPVKIPCVVQAQVESSQSNVAEPVETEDAVFVEAQPGDDQVAAQEFSINADVEDVVADRAYWDFTPPSCSLGLDFGPTPPGPDINTTVVVPAAVPTPPPAVVSTTQAPAMAQTVNNAPQDRAAASPIDHMAAAPRDLKNSEDNPIDSNPFSGSEPADLGK